MSYKRYLVFRTLQLVVMFWIIATFLFFLFRSIPGSYLDMLTLQGASPEAVAQIKEKWGLDEPLHKQYLNFLQNIVELDLGNSRQHRVPVTEYIKQKIVNTFVLVGPGITVAYLIGGVVGTVAGMKRDSWFEKYGIIPFIIGGTVPSFFTSIVLVIVFAGMLGWFPTSGMFSIGSQTGTGFERYFTWEFAHHYTLPFLAVLLRYTYVPTLIMRTNVVETMGQDFIYYQRVTGAPWIERFRSILKHSSLPVITLYPVSMTRAISGLVLIEMVFNWPGIGYAVVDAVLNRDIPVLQAVFLLVAAFILISNFLVDIFYSVIDPRITLTDQ